LLHGREHRSGATIRVEEEPDHLLDLRIG
jgi:hypothetical protein